MELSRRQTPQAIWFQSIPGYSASISVVNHLYRYEVFEVSTGHRVRMASHRTLIKAKSSVFGIFLKALKGVSS